MATPEEEEFVEAVRAGVAPLVDLLVLVNDCAPLLGGTLAAELDALVRSRIARLIDGAAVVAAAEHDAGPALVARVTAAAGGPR